MTFGGSAGGEGCENRTSYLSKVHSSSWGLTTSAPSLQFPKKHLAVKLIELATIGPAGITDPLQHSGIASNLGEHLLVETGVTWDTWGRN